jgi:hypothetical protein
MGVKLGLSHSAKVLFENLMVRENGKSRLMRSFMLCCATKYCLGGRGFHGNKYIVCSEEVARRKPITWTI